MVRVVAALRRSNGGGDDFDGLRRSSKDSRTTVAAGRGGVSSRGVEVRVVLVEGVGRRGVGTDFDGTARGCEARTTGAARGGNDLDGNIGGDKVRVRGRGLESSRRAANDLTLGDFCARSSGREVVALSSRLSSVSSTGERSHTHLVADDTAGDDLLVRRGRSQKVHVLGHARRFTVSRASTRRECDRVLCI